MTDARGTPPIGLASWVEVSAVALAQNVRTLRERLATRSKLGVVVKSNAYGHGLIPAARAFLQAGADWLVVNYAHEALALRAASIDAPLYVCGTVFPHDAPAIVAARARTIIVDAEMADALDTASRAARCVTPVHLKVETGTHRQGLAVEALLALARRIRDLPGLQIEGLATHFADIEDTTNHRFADEQHAKLLAAQRALAELGVVPPILHAANSAATLLEEKTHGDLVRVGIAAYGLWPSRETLAAWQERARGTAPLLLPALSWRARLAQVKEIAAGAYVGYGRTWRTTRPSRIAILPLGYHEGYDRRFSNVAHVLVRGMRAPVRGRVCMNMTMVDVTDIPDVKSGDVATLLGSDGDERITAEQLAAWMGSIHYEVVSRIHPDQRRIEV